MKARITLLGMGIDNLRLADAVNRVDDLIRRYRTDAKARYVATVNVDFIVNALGLRAKVPRHPELLRVLREADLVTADGMPLVWLSRLLKTPLAERVTGADLVPALAKRAAENGNSLFLLGGRTGIAEQAAAVLKAQYPGVRIVGCAAPFIHADGPELADACDEDRDVVDAVNAAAPDILLLAFGNPKQELWYQRNRHRLNVPVSVGVGGTFEFVAGTVRRAPHWIGKAGLEWIYRITQDPKRLWKRYLVGLGMFSVLAMQALWATRCGWTRKPVVIEETHTQSGASGVTFWRGPIDAVSKPAAAGRLIMDLRDQGVASAAHLAPFTDWLQRRSLQNRVTQVVVDDSFLRNARAQRLSDLLAPYLVAAPDEAWRQVAESSGGLARFDRTLVIAGDFDNDLAAQIDLEDVSKIKAVNLEYCSLINSAGLGSLVRMDRRMREFGGHLVLGNLSPIVQQSLRVARLDQYFSNSFGSRQRADQSSLQIPVVVNM